MFDNYMVTCMKKSVTAKQFLKRLLLSDVELLVARYWMREGSWVSRPQDNDHHFLVFVEQGQLGLRVNAQDYIISAGECLWVQPGQERMVTGTYGDETVRHINLRFRITDEGSFLACRRGCMHIPAAQTLYRYFQDVLVYDLEPGALAQEKLLSLSLAIFVEALRLDKRDQVRASSLLSSQQKQLIMQRIADGICSGLSPSDLADALDLSLDYFTRCFRSVYGVPPRRYLLEERMRHAARYLIDTNMAIKDVAAQVGIEDVNYYCRQFKKVMGLTPSAFRQRGVLPKR